MRISHQPSPTLSASDTSHPTRSPPSPARDPRVNPRATSDSSIASRKRRTSMSAARASGATATACGIHASSTAQHATNVHGAHASHRRGGIATTAATAAPTSTQ